LMPWPTGGKEDVGGGRYLDPHLAIAAVGGRSPGSGVV
jgi:hypothetical protein